MQVSGRSAWNLALIVSAKPQLTSPRLVPNLLAGGETHVLKH